MIRGSGDPVPSARPHAFAALAVEEARSWIGTPYRHQASLKGTGCDCLGLLRGVWRALYGDEPEPVPGYSADWAEGSGRETLLEAARRHLIELAGDAEILTPGNVLIFRWRPHLPAKHCGIVVDDRRMVHAYQAAGQVAEGFVHLTWLARVAGVFAFRPSEIVANPTLSGGAVRPGSPKRLGAGTTGTGEQSVGQE